MNKEQNQDNKVEEIDLIVFLNYFGNIIKGVIKALSSVIKELYAVFISIFKVFFINLKLILLVLVCSIAIGFVLDRNKDNVYYSEMFVTPHFDSKYELVSNIKYFKSLVQVKDYEELSSRFDISYDEAKTLVDFEIEKGPESENEQITAFNVFLKSLDSVTRTKIQFEDYLENRNIYNSNIFLIRAKSNKYNIFTKLQKGLVTSIDNDFSKLQKRIRDSVLTIEKNSLNQSLKEITKLKETYLQVLEKESNKETITSSLSNTFGLQVEKTATKEDVFVSKEIDIYNKLSNIEKQLVLNNSVADIQGAFKEKGLLENKWFTKFKFLIPIMSLVLLFFIFSFYTFYKYTLNYKK